MSDEGYTVDLDGLADRVAEMSAFDRDAEAAGAELDRVVDRLHATWSGAAADAHLEAHERWVTAPAEMRVGLALVRAAAHRAHGSYGDAVSANQQMWRSVR